MDKLPNLPFECISIYTIRHPGRNSLRAILPEALRVNANPFQTNLCWDDVDTICAISIKVNTFLNLNNTFNQILITSNKLVMRHLCV